MAFVKWMDNAPLWVKILLALPVTGIVWAIYRVVKGAVKGNMAILIGGILWILLGWLALWLVDLVCIIIYKNPKVLA